MPICAAMKQSLSYMTADLNRKLDNLNQYLDRSLEQQSADKKIGKNTQSF